MRVDELPFDLILQSFSWLSLSELSDLKRVSRFFQKAAIESTCIADLSQFATRLAGCQIHTFLIQSRHLRILNLSYCSQVEDIDFKNIALPCLRSFAMKACPHITARALATLLETSTLLEELDIKRSISACDDDLLTMLSHRPLLKTLKIEQGYDITSDGLKLVLNACSRLVHLELINCPLIDFYALMLEEQDVTKMCSLPLEYLDISRCRSVTNDFIWALSCRCPRIAYLNFSDCSLVSDDGLLYLNQLQNLQRLFCGGCYLISDQGLQNLVQTGNALHLHEMDISACSSITDQGLHLLKNKTPSLSSLDVRDCSGISQRGIEHLATQDSRPDLILMSGFMSKMIRTSYRTTSSCLAIVS